MWPIFKEKYKGFSIVELLVSLSIVFIIASAILINQNSYAESSALTNLADNLASSITQAQVYGNAVRQAPGTDSFTASYGVSMNLLAGGSDRLFVSFIDRDSNQRYSGSWSCTANNPSDNASGCLEFVERVDMQRGNYIKEMCLIDSTEALHCGLPKRADISFLRPKLEAQLELFDSQGQSLSWAVARGLRIELKSPNGLSRYVTIYKNGQVSVN
jgi:Tfp pilus assembly protein FimT